MSHQISPTKALAMIIDFIQNPQLNSIALNAGIGGGLTLDVFNKFASNDGKSLVLWFCYNQANNKFLIALEPDPVTIDPSSLPRTPDAANLLTTSDHVVYSGSLSAGDIEEFFVDQSGLPAMDDTMTNANVISEISSFLSDFPDRNGNPFNSTGLGYIENDNDEVLNFITQSSDIAGVRYYFGLDAATNNKIKVIFVPIDAQGKNILKFSNGNTPFYLDREEP